MRGAPRPGVPAHVGQRLLHDPVRGAVHLGRQRSGGPSPSRRTRHGQPGGRACVDQRVRGRRGRAPAGGGAASSAGAARRAPTRTSRSASALACLIAVSARRGPAPGWSSSRCSADAGLDVDQREVVAEHVVQLAGDAQPLLAGLPARLLGSGPLAFGLRLGHFTEPFAAGAADLGQCERDQHPRRGRGGPGQRRLGRAERRRRTRPRTAARARPATVPAPRRTGPPARTGTPDRPGSPPTRRRPGRRAPP